MNKKLRLASGMVPGALAICRSQAHRAFVMQNLQEWTKNRQLVPGWRALEKPQHLVDFEKANRALLAGGHLTSAPAPPAPPPCGPTVTVSAPSAVGSSSSSGDAAVPKAAKAAGGGLSAFGAKVL